VVNRQKKVEPSSNLVDGLDEIVQAKSSLETGCSW